MVLPQKVSEGNGMWVRNGAKAQLIPSRATPSGQGTLLGPIKEKGPCLGTGAVWCLFPGFSPGCLDVSVT